MELIQTREWENIEKVLASWNVSDDVLKRVRSGPEKQIVSPNVQFWQQVRLVYDYLTNKTQKVLPPLGKIGIDPLLTALAAYYVHIQSISDNTNYESTVLVQETSAVLSLAKNLGMWELKRELEDIIFKFANPERYTETKFWFEKLKANNSKIWSDLVHELKSKCTPLVADTEVKINYC